MIKPVRRVAGELGRVGGRSDRTGWGRRGYCGRKVRRGGSVGWVIGCVCVQYVYVCVCVCACVGWVGFAASCECERAGVVRRSGWWVERGADSSSSSLRTSATRTQSSTIQPSPAADKPTDTTSSRATTTSLTRSRPGCMVTQTRSLSFRRNPIRFRCHNIPS